MKMIGVGVIGASASRPVWATISHLPAIAALPDFALRAVATSSAATAQAAAERFGVPGFGDAREMIGHPDVDLVVVAVKLPYHFELVSAALDAGKMVMCEWPLGLDLDQTERLAKRAQRANVATFVGLQARTAPALRYARDLVRDGYVGEVLATTLVGSGIGWGPDTDRAEAWKRDAAGGVSALSVPTMHALDAIGFVVGDLADVRAVTAVRRPCVRLVDGNGENEIAASAPDHVSVSATLTGGAVASVFYRGGVSRGDNLRWEINGTDGDLVLTSTAGNLQVLDPVVEGGRGDETVVRRLAIPSHYDLAPVGLEGPAANVARLYAAFAEGLRDRATPLLAPDFAHAAHVHRWLDVIAASAASGPARPIAKSGSAPDISKAGPLGAYGTAAYDTEGFDRSHVPARMV